MRKPKIRRLRPSVRKQVDREREYPGVKFDPRIDSLTVPELLLEDAVEMLRCLLYIAQDTPTCKIGFAAFKTSVEEHHLDIEDLELCGHEWVVFSTAINDGCLMLQCVMCGAHGSVDDPSADEWSEAFCAPSNPYRWMENHRVNVRGVLPPDKWYVRKDEYQSSLDSQSDERASQ